MTEFHIEAHQPGEIDWSQRDDRALIEHIIVRYHEPLRDELPRLEAMAEKVLRVHGAKHPEMFSALAEAISILRRELEPHMDKEERVLFPWILCRRPIPSGGPLEVMSSEHEDAEIQLERIRYLTGGFRVREEACKTWRALWSGLEALDRELRMHMHLENEILFPRVRAQG